MRYATTFSGIGGWELGLNACGWELAWQCEFDPKCRAFLQERFGVPVYPDIRTLVDDRPERVDALIGSPPCQPFSVAGAQRGTSDERHLFPAFLDAVRFLRPRWVLMEQVPAILSLDGGRAAGGYLGPLAALGYDLLWNCIPACAVGANHRRDRLWIIAHAQDRGVRCGSPSGKAGQPALLGEALSDPHGEGLAQRVVQPRGAGGDAIAPPGPASFPCGDVADPSRLQPGRPQQWPQRERIGKGSESQPMAHAQCGRGDRRRPGTSWRFGGPESLGFHDDGRGGQGNGLWLTEPDVGRVAHGVPHRVDRLKGLGNAVVPQIPYLIGQAINAIEEGRKL